MDYKYVRGAAGSNIGQDKSFLKSDDDTSSDGMSNFINTTYIDTSKIIDSSTNQNHQPVKVNSIISIEKTKTLSHSLLVI
jgi:hypothetical protein